MSSRDEELARAELKRADSIAQELHDLISDISGIRLRKIVGPSEHAYNLEANKFESEEIAKAKEHLK